MATRVGKYKITKRESALNLTDGGTVTGNLTVTGDVTLSGLNTSGVTNASNTLFTTASAGVGGITGSLKGLKVLCLA